MGFRKRQRHTLGCFANIFMTKFDSKVMALEDPKILAGDG